MKQKLLRSIRKTFAMLVFSMLLCTVAFAQKTVTGTVRNESDQKPIPFATVTVRGTTVATSTNANGDFEISVPQGRNSLLISSAGYDNLEIDISNLTVVNAMLKVKTSSLDEIFVTGYTTQRKKDITGAISVVDVKEMKQLPAGTGEEALQGRASGLTVITSGQPGAASDIRIRGITSFGNNQPLIVVDGVQGTSLHDINPQDIETVQVLKDASASIYGVRGSNGVIIITTKKGRAGRAKVSYDMYYGFTTPGTGYDMANPQQEADAMWLQQRNSSIPNPNSKQYGNGPNPTLPDYIQTAPYVDPITGETKTYGYHLCNCPDDEGIVGPGVYDINSRQITAANKTGTNWYDEITRTAPMQSHNLTVSGGSDKNTYLFGVGYLNQQGIGIYQYLKRYSVRLNTMFNVKNNIRIGENIYAYFKQNPLFGNQSEGSPFSVAYRESTIIPVYDIMGNFGGTKSQDLGNSSNPYANMYRTKDNKNQNTNVSGNVFAEVDFLKNFTIRTSFGGYIDNYHYYNFTYTPYENAEGNMAANSFSEGGGYNESWTWQNTLTYGNAWGDHVLKALVGTEAISNKGRSLSGSRGSYFSTDPDYWILATGNPTSQGNDGNAYQNALWSQLARVEYSYAGKYLINATIRRDGTSVFSEDQRWGWFPAVSGAWRVSDEGFMNGVNWINDLKLRASWGKLGSSVNVNSTNPYDLYRSSAGRSYYDIGGTSTSPVSGFFQSNIGNANTTWEGDIITNFGLDATLFNRKFDFTIEWYQKKVSGLLFQDPIDIIYGGGTPPQINIGDMQNTGIDFNATYHGNVGKDFTFDISGNFTTYNNEIVDVPGPGYFPGPIIRNVVIQRNQEGHPVGAFYGYDVIGLFQDADDVAKSPTQTDAKPGVFKYRDVNNDGVIDEDDRTFIGDPNPNFTYGINLSAGFKGFDFSAFFYGSQGNDIFNQTLYFTDFPDFFKGAIRREAAVNSWTTTNLNAKVPLLQLAGGFSTDQVTNSYFISNGSYFRLKQMQIGYTLPTGLIGRFGLDRLRVYVQAANMFTLTKYNGLDPELQPSDGVQNTAQTINSPTGLGIDQGNYPHTPSFLFGINLNF